MSTKSKYTSFNIFPYQFSWADENFSGDIQCIIRIYGLNEKNESVYIRIEDFTIPLIVELPDNVVWSEERIRIVANTFQTLTNKKNMQPVSIHFEQKNPLHPIIRGSLSAITKKECISVVVHTGPLAQQKFHPKRCA